MIRRKGTSLEHGNRQAWLLGVVAALLVMCLAATVAVGAKEISDARTSANKRAGIVASQQAELTCVAKWANTYSERAQQITEANSERVRALDALVRAIRGSTASSFARALGRYLAASDQLNRQVKTHPLPPAPQFLCAQDAHVAPVPLPSVVTVTATPKPASTVTVTRTRTVPGPVRTVVVPGPVRTRVVTVTVPPGRHR